MKRAAVLFAALALCLAATVVLAGNAAPKKGGSCCAEDSSGAKKCAPASETAVTLTGTVLCEHCDLHAASSCNPVFKADGRDGYLPFCPETKDVSAIKAAAGNGKVKLEVKGKICRTTEGKELLAVESFSKKS
jgi:hypothetical protein